MGFFYQKIKFNLIACEVVKKSDTNNIYHGGIMIPRVFLDKDKDMISVQTTWYYKYLLFCKNPPVSYSFMLNSSNTHRCATQMTIENKNNLIYRNSLLLSHHNDIKLWRSLFLAHAGIFYDIVYQSGVTILPKNVDPNYREGVLKSIEFKNNIFNKLSKNEQAILLYCIIQNEEPQVFNFLQQLNIVSEINSKDIQEIISL